MRTRTNLYLGDGNEGFSKILKNFYSVGMLEIVYDDGEKLSEFCKVLKKDYDIVLTEESDYVGSEYFAVAVGQKAFRTVRKNCKGKFASFVKFVTMDMFAEGEKYAEFLYLSCDEYNSASEAKVMECYTALLSATAEGLGVYYRGMNCPFVDKGLKRMLERGRGILLGESDRENFIKDSLALTKEITEKISEKNLKFTAVEMGKNLGGGLGDYAESACFLHRTLILFTKFRFRDMLISVARPIKDVGEGYPFYERDDLLITDGDMKKIFSFIGGFRNKVGLNALINAFEQSVDATDIAFAEIYNRGIYEGIKEYG